MLDLLEEEKKRMTALVWAWSGCVQFSHTRRASRCRAATSATPFQQLLHVSVSHFVFCSSPSTSSRARSIHRSGSVCLLSTCRVLTSRTHKCVKEKEREKVGHLNRNERENGLRLCVCVFIVGVERRWIAPASIAAVLQLFGHSAELNLNTTCGRVSSRSVRPACSSSSTETQVSSTFSNPNTTRSLTKWISVADRKISFLSFSCFVSIFMSDEVAFHVLVLFSKRPRFALVFSFR